MSRIIEATTAAEYFSLCNELACDQLDLFRGQTNNYPKIIPSLYRTTTVGEESHDSIIRLFVNCYRLGSYEIIKEKYIDNINESYGQGHNKGFESWDSFYEFVELIQALPGGDDLNYKREDFIWGVISSLEMNWDRHGDALLQHYGIPSRALNVSYNAAVALWFAAHSFRKLTDGTATYVPGGEGQPVAYVFSSSGVEIEDLRVGPES
jgi:FRG domain